ncbi:hypothetical protein SAMN05216228_102435 [Rhizobium tibeticum]|uniref:Uncharacterized protein n=1 Tax=Rhizobium tibeticum TaxID=501024 RepID=A0A1H8SC91_9HYPH|nr:hypothetical protein RTCCBAU85039_4772 [Rhizobium tibeticum]SEO76195.1 hypothetical protein SAMN05216228_102435 [Rhizobium tibeticum]
MISGIGNDVGGIHPYQWFVIHDECDGFPDIVEFRLSMLGNIARDVISKITERAVRLWKSR